MLANITPGMRSSEFKLFVLNVIGQIILDLRGTVTDGTAVKYSLVGAVAYIISRGLAKYEPRG